MAIGKNITQKKGTGVAYHIPYNTEAFWKNIKWLKGEGEVKFQERKLKLKRIGVGKNIKLLGIVYTPA